jgi:hypothetical protein
MTTIDSKQRRVNQTFVREFQAIGSVSTRISIDTIELFFPKPPKGLRTSLQAALGRRIEIKYCWDATGDKKAVRAIINRPNQRVLAIADELLKAHKSARLSRVDIAVDFQTSSADSTWTLFKLLDQHLILKWRSPKARKRRFDTTVYWGGKGWWKRNLVIYDNKRAARTIRLELRFFGSQSVRRAGLADPAGLLQLNPRSKLEHNIIFASLTDNYIQKVIRRTVSAERKRHMKERSLRRRTPTAELVVDRCRSSTARRAEYALRRVDMQGLRSATRSRNSLKIPLGHLLNIPEFLSWPDPPEQSRSMDGLSVINTHAHTFS